MTFADRIEKVVLTENSKYGIPSDLRILEDYELCNRYRVLPDAGGLYDQDADLLAKFKIIDKVMQKKARLEEKKQEMLERAKQATGGQPT
jgi:hypothetical protein